MGYFPGYGHPGRVFRTNGRSGTFYRQTIRLKNCGLDSWVTLWRHNGHVFEDIFLLCLPFCHDVADHGNTLVDQETADEVQTTTNTLDQTVWLKNPTDILEETQRTLECIPICVAWYILLEIGKICPTTPKITRNN